MPSDTHERRAAERITAVYPVQPVAKPTGKKFVRGRRGVRPPVPVRAAARFDPSLHPHDPHTGRFRTTLDRIVHGLRQWADGGGKGDPFEGFTREQLRRTGVQRGLTFRRGASEHEIRDGLLANLRDALAGDSGKPDTVPAKKAVPKKVAKTPKLSDDPDVRAVQIENRIREAYREATAASGRRALVPLADIRDRLPDLDRVEVDAALIRMARTSGGGVMLTPNEDRKRRTSRDREAALKVPSYGSEDANDWLTIEDPSPRPSAAKKVVPKVDKPDLDALRELDDPEAIRDALDLHKVPELQAMLADAGLKKSGRKRELVDRLVEHIGGGEKSDKSSTPEAPKAAEKAVPGKPDMAATRGSYIGPQFQRDDAILAEFEDLQARRNAPDYIALDWDQARQIDDRYWELADHPQIQRAEQEKSIDEWDARFRAEHAKGMRRDAAHRLMAERTREALAGKKVAIRATPATLGRVLEDGRYRTQFETGKSGGLNDTDVRARYEAQWFGLDADTDPRVRPVYGYVMVDGDRPAGVGRKDRTGDETDALSQYGQIQIVLKDSVRPRTTAMVGDSLNFKHAGLPSPIDDPDWRSFTPASEGMMGRVLSEQGFDRDYSDPEFHANAYVEAQVHGGVSVDDVDEIVFPDPPSAALRAQMQAAGLRWRVLRGES